MNKKGFTLIELLAVITILAIIILIASISVSDILKGSEQELSVVQIEAIKDASKSWSSDNMDVLPANNGCSFIMLKDLKDNGLLDSKIINQKNNKNISNEMKIKITSRIGNNGKSIFDYEVDSDDISECTYIGSNMYVDIPKGLTPVLYDKKLNSWRVPNINEEWYDYDKQEWANAVVLGKGKTKKPGETVKVDGTEVLMMLVYIPRYEYKIEGDYGKHPDGTPGTQALPGEIEVKFVNTNQTEADNGYLMHPAFKFGTDELYGIWVGKFELSHETLSSNKTDNNLECSSTSCTNASGLRILPNVPSLRRNDVSNFWYGIKSIENTSSFGLTNMDTHMMKNSEWGAVAYLSQSKYGKYGNNDYEGAQKEVYINNSSSYYTGRSGGNPGGSTPINGTYTDQTRTTQFIKYGYYTYDGYLLSYNTNNKTETRDINKGTGASTTGNIYGVYDMSGGAEEYVMGAYGDSQGIYSGYRASYNSLYNNSGFNGRTGNDNGNVTNGVQVPDSKYYDKYANSTNSDTNDGSLSCNNGICYGHGISEIKGSTTDKGWYRDYTYMVSSSYPWFVRGGSGPTTSAAGVFSRNSYGGNSDGGASARVVGFGK